MTFIIDFQMWKVDLQIIFLWGNNQISKYLSPISLPKKNLIHCQDKYNLPIKKNNNAKDLNQIAKLHIRHITSLGIIYFICGLS